MPPTPPVVAIVGPTASGKSDLAIALALRMRGEVVNADAMQLYRGMDIGTAKLPEGRWRGVPHHLLDVWPLEHRASVVEYRSLARDAFDAIGRRGHRALLVGGSGLYVRAALDHLDFPATDASVRARLERELETDGPAALHARLQSVDPAAAAAILPGNGRRLVRALEVVEVTGKPFIATLPEPRYAVPAVQVGLDVPREELRTRIEARVDGMWQQGLVNEVARLADQGLRTAPTASRALGYAQALAFLDGRLTESEARARTVRDTWRFARRQQTWFRRDQRVCWIPAGDGLPAAALVRHALAVALAA